MQSQEIPRDQWQSFLDGFSKRHLGEPTTIELLAKEFGDQVESNCLPLLGITADNKDSEAELIEVMVGDDPQANINRIVHKPRALRVAKADDGSEQALEIESHDEPTVLVRFGSPPFPTKYGA